MVLLLPKKKRQNTAPTREVCVFLTDRHPKTEKSLDEKFPYLHGERFFKYYIDRLTYVYIEFLSQLPIPTPAIIENESFNSDKDICFGPSGPT